MGESSNRKRRILKRVGITLGSLGILLLLVILFWLGPVTRQLMVWTAPYALGTEISIDHLTINPRKGHILLQGLALGNPDGFGSSNSMELASLEMHLDMGSLFSQTVTVHRIDIEQPHFTFDQHTRSDNLAEYIHSVQDFIGYDPTAPPEPPSEKKLRKQAEKEARRRKARDEGTAKVTVVEALRIHDAQMHVKHTEDPQRDITLGFDTLTVSMTNGAVQLTDLYASHPERLRSERMASLSSLQVELDPATLHRPPLVVQDVQINHPHLFVEWATDTSTLGELLQIAQDTQKRIKEWPLPDNDALSKPKKEPIPAPEVHRIGVDDFQFHLLNSADPALTLQATLEQLELHPVEGTFALSAFSISNPQRLETPHLFYLEGVQLQLDPASLTNAPLHITHLAIDRPYIFLELNKETHTTAELMKAAEDIIRHVPPASVFESMAADLQADAAPAAAPPPPILDALRISDIQIKLYDTTTTNTPPEPVCIFAIDAIEGRPTEGTLHVSEITAPNPAGYQAAHMFHLKQIAIDLDPDTLYVPPLRIRRILVDSPEVHLEQTETSGNVAELQLALMQMVPDAPPPSVLDSQPAETATQPIEPPVELELLLVTNLTVTARLPAPVVQTNAPDTTLLSKATAKATQPVQSMRSHTANRESSEPFVLPLVSLELLSVEGLTGRISLSNLKIGSRHGFSSRYMVSLPDFLLEIDPASITTDLLLIHKVHILAPDISYERQLTTDNIKSFQQMIETATIHRDSTMKVPAEAPEEEAKSEQKVILYHLLVDKGRVRAKISALPTARIPLPTIEMRDIGVEEEGARVSDVTSRIFTTFYDSIIGVVANTTGIAGDALKGAGAFTMDALGNLGGKMRSGEAVEEPTVQETEELPSRQTEELPRLRRRIFQR